MICTCDTILCKETICIIDFAGNNTQCGFWADWCPNSNRVVFGGDWFDIPDLKIDKKPTEKIVDDYVNQFKLFQNLKKEII